MTGKGGIQTGVGTQPAIGVAGDFCDLNPRATVDAGPSGLVSGAAGLTVGRFAWLSYSSVDGDSAPAVANNNGVGQVAGFVAREQQALITTYLADASQVIAPGFQCTLFSSGSFFAINDDTIQMVQGTVIYADQATGKVLAQATTAAVTGAITSQTSAFTGSIVGNVLTVSAVASGLLVPGTVVGGTVGGSGVVAGTRIIAQLSGTPNGVGTYALDIPEQLVNSGSLTGSYGLLNVTAVASGTLAVGDVLTGTGANVSGSTIYGLGTGLGGLGTYYTNPSVTVGSSALTVSNSVKTKYVAMSSALPGELVKISSHILG